MKTIVYFLFSIYSLLFVLCFFRFLCSRDCLIYLMPFLNIFCVIIFWVMVLDIPVLPRCSRRIKKKTVFFFEGSHYQWTYSSCIFSSGGLGFPFFFQGLWLQGSGEDWRARSWFRPEEKRHRLRYDEFMTVNSSKSLHRTGFCSSDRDLAEIG